MKDKEELTITPRNDCSVITIDCAPQEYSASRLAHAVEDSDAHLTDLLTAPGEDGHLLVTLRVAHRDPSAAVRSLERYEFNVIEARGADEEEIRDVAIAAERLLSLQTLLSV